MAKLTHVYSDAKKRLGMFRKEPHSALLHCVFNEHLLYSQNNDLDALHEPHFHYAHYISLKRIASSVYRSKIRGRCIYSGCARAVSSKYLMSRFVFKTLSRTGRVNGITKSSW